MEFLNTFEVFASNNMAVSIALFAIIVLFAVGIVVTRKSEEL